MDRNYNAFLTIQNYHCESSYWRVVDLFLHASTLDRNTEYTFRYEYIVCTFVSSYLHNHDFKFVCRNKVNPEFNSIDLYILYFNG
jgi:hypothetical protein